MHMCGKDISLTSFTYNTLVKGDNFLASKQASKRNVVYKREGTAKARPARRDASVGRAFVVYEAHGKVIRQHDTLSREWRGNPGADIWQSVVKACLSPRKGGF